MESSDDTTSVIPVKVAVRVRPFDEREKEENAQQCLQYYVKQNQDAVYESCAAPLIGKLFKGYNCTVFAYGQTGSGKTYTMGTEQTTESVFSSNQGIIPQMVANIFNRIEQHQSPDSFVVNCSMLEIYEERVIDLLAIGRSNKDTLSIRETNKGNVFVQGLSERCVSTLLATIAELERGCHIRSSGETAMNTKSSRSHAIFTLTIHKAATETDATNFQVKLNLVDLAGSERLKKTQAQGERMREGIKINEGLLALGNVISALTETGPTRQHIPYRDSKLTRLLQDSLGGNSYTIMIACVSPADTNCEETLSTLRYAERAKRIKNKPIINQDPNAATIQLLRQQVQDLTHRMLQYESGDVTGSGERSVNRRELDELRSTIHRRDLTVDRLQTRLAEAVADRARLYSQLASSEAKCKRMSKATETMRQLMSEKLDTIENRNQRLDGRAVLVELQNTLASQFDIGDENELSFDIKKTEMSELSENDDSDNSNSLIDSQYATHFADIESARAREVDDLVNQINEHETRIANINANERETRQLREKYIELQAKVDKIQTERDQLAEQVRRAMNSTKISEERRKRLQEVERELAEKRRALNELKNVEKINAQREEDLKKHQQALKELKFRQVHLMKEQRQEAEKFRKWKLKYDLEMNRMKHRERKREYDHVRAAQQKEQQLRVCQRKLEETHAFNKRMQLQLDRKDVAKNRKFADSTETDKLVREIKAFLEQELDLVSSTEEAQINCIEFIQQRKDASREMAKLQKKRDQLFSYEPPKKRRTGTPDENIDHSVEIVALDAAIEALKQQIELRSAEIRELQNKYSAVDLDACAEQRWSCIHTVAQAKCALKLLFEMIIDERRDERHADESIDELKAENRSLFAKISEKEEIVNEFQRKLDASNKEKRDLISMSIRKHQEHEAIVRSIVNRELNNTELDAGTMRQLKLINEDIFQRETLEKYCIELEEQFQELKNQTSAPLNRSRLFNSVASTSSLPPPIRSTGDGGLLKPKRLSKRTGLFKPLFPRK